MLSKILPIAGLLAGAATAACPLSVEISGTIAHIAHVAVTNTGAEPITVFKGNTVLSEQATKDLLVADTNGKALPFQGMYVNYMRSGIPLSMFQTIQPGETVTSSVNAAKTYKLAGVPEAKVTTIQGFKYVTGATAPIVLVNYYKRFSKSNQTTILTSNY